MKIKIQFHTSNFSYVAPVIVQKKTIEQNHLLSASLYINEIKDETFIGTLDLTPLNHFHQYNLEQWRFILDSFFNQTNLDEEKIDLKRPYFNMLSHATQLTNEILFSGELLFIVENLLFAYIEKKRPAALSFIHKKPIEVNGLYSKDLPLFQLPSWLKIKIRPTKSSLESTIALINDFKSKKDHYFFRLDGNAQFELSEIDTFLTALEKHAPINSFIEYIEEPLKNFNEYHLLKKITNLPIAFDESLLTFKDSLSLLPSNSFCILKPSLLGLSKCFELMDQNASKMIISSSYETASAIRPLLYLAALNPSTAHGLDTLKFLPKHLSIKMNHFALPF